MPELEQRAPDFFGGQSIEHVGVIGVRAVGANHFGDEFNRHGRRVLFNHSSVACVFSARRSGREVPHRLKARPTSYTESSHS